VKNHLLTVLCAWMISACGENGVPPEPAPSPSPQVSPASEPPPDPDESLSPEQVEERIAALNVRILPPVGTAKAEVDAVFGVPGYVPELEGKGSSADYPMHVYELLPPRGPPPSFRAALQVTCRDGMLHRARIHHVCVAKGRRLIRPGTPEYRRQQEARARERRRVLADLREIVRKYASNLDGASWNE